jgi:hypothetical protein
MNGGSRIYQKLQSAYPDQNPLYGSMKYQLNKKICDKYTDKEKPTWCEGLKNIITSENEIPYMDIEAALPYVDAKEASECFRYDNSPIYVKQLYNNQLAMCDPVTAQFLDDYKDVRSRFGRVWYKDANNIDKNMGTYPTTQCYGCRLYVDIDNGSIPVCRRYNSRYGESFRLLTGAPVSDLHLNCPKQCCTNSNVIFPPPIQGLR